MSWRFSRVVDVQEEEDASQLRKLRLCSLARSGLTARGRDDRGGRRMAEGWRSPGETTRVVLHTHGTWHMAFLRCSIAAVPLSAGGGVCRRDSERQLEDDDS